MYNNDEHNNNSEYLFIKAICTIKSPRISKSEHHHKSAQYLTVNTTHHSNIFHRSIQYAISKGHVQLW
uniref:Uncharacterized protein n=1 Tax=Kalanchoe fedtschenkoi TaxID=63787 RepID=A0A7N0V302_KALFE